MNQSTTQKSSWPQFLFVFVVLVGLCIAIYYLPRFLVPQHFSAAAEKAMVLQNEYRRTIVQAFGVIGIALGAYFTWRRVTAAEGQVAAMQAQVSIASDGQMNERFARAIEQLGDESQAVRMGGIYSLGHLASNAERFREPVVKTLAAFIMSRSTTKREAPDDDDTPKPQGIEASLTVPHNAVAADAGPAKHDIQTAIRVVSQYQSVLVTIDKQRLDLIGVNIAFSNISLGNLAKMNLAYSSLVFVRCDNASFKESALSNCRLVKIRGENTDFSDSALDWANLSEADLDSPNFTGADLQYANLQCANFSRANLAFADFSNANLRGAKFDDATYNQSGASHPEFFGADICGADFSGFDYLDSRRFVDTEHDDMTQWPHEFDPRKIDPTRPGHLPGD